MYEEHSKISHRRTFIALYSFFKTQKSTLHFQTRNQTYQWSFSAAPRAQEMFTKGRRAASIPEKELKYEWDCMPEYMSTCMSTCRKFCFFTAERSERVQKTYFSLTNIFVHLLLFCATPLNLPSWSLFFLVVVEVSSAPVLVSTRSHTTPQLILLFFQSRSTV